MLGASELAARSLRHSGTTSHTRAPVAHSPTGKAACSSKAASSRPWASDWLAPQRVTAR